MTFGLPPSRSNSANVRAGIHQAKVGETGFNVIALEALIVAAVCGVRTQSWAVGIFVFLAVIAAFNCFTEKTAIVFSAAMGGLWALVTFMVAQSSGPENALAIAVLAGLIGAGAHIAGLQHVRDIAGVD